MIKRILCVAALSACINSAHADWDIISFKEDPITDEISMQVGASGEFDSFKVVYTCTDNKDKFRSLTFIPEGSMKILMAFEKEGRARVRVDKGKVYDFDFKIDQISDVERIFVLQYKQGFPEEAQKFAELEKDLLQSTSRVVFELNGKAHVISSGNAREAAKAVIGICGALSPAS